MCRVKIQKYENAFNEYSRIKTCKTDNDVLTCGRVEQSRKNERINTVKKYTKKPQRNPQKSITF